MFLIVHFACDKTTGLNRVSLFFEIINPQGFETMGIFIFVMKSEDSRGTFAKPV